MQPISGLGKTDRERLSKVLRGTKGTISVSEAAEILGMSRSSVAKLLSRWAKKGWLSRVKRGFYVSVPLESQTTDLPLEDAWLVTDKLYGPCYIGGWTAAEYWDLTEQIFRTIIVMTTQQPRERKQTIKGTTFLLRTISNKALFGLTPVWRGQVKVNVSDPTRTLLDMLNDPLLGGGIRSVVDMFCHYLQSDKKDLVLLINYADRLGNGAVFKRLGFLLELYCPDEHEIIEQCKARLSSGNARLDPKLPSERLITRWRLWVSNKLMNEKTIRKAAMNNDDVLLIGGEVSVSRRAFTALLDHNHIKRVSLFGSAARREITPTSDIDLLVEFEEGKSPSLGGMVVISDAFSQLFDGRKVDIATPAILNNPYRRREIEKDMELLYAS
jgi:predicted transcriptional regulator of viral defense system/predicted nucleotidyltransferase